MNETERLVFFLYLLMRDELPVGHICDLVNQSTNNEVIYSNKHLESLARDYADRIYRG